MMLEAKSLRKALIPSSLLSNPSPANLQSTRLALHVDDDLSTSSVFIASGCHVYKVEVSMGKLKSTVTKGKESLLIPVQAQVVQSLLLDRCPHRSEIQSVVLAEEDGDNYLIMGTVDSFGHVIISRLVGVDAGFHIRCLLGTVVLGKGVGLGSASAQYAGPWQLLLTVSAKVSIYMIKIFICGVSERSSDREETRGSVIGRTWNLQRLWYPASLSFLRNSLSADESSVLLVAEGSQLSIWDLRASSNGGCVQRVCGAVGEAIYAICSSQSGPIAAGGSDRTVTIYDPRRWSALSRWVNCSKYEITGLSFSSLDPAYIYIQGVDYEVFCGQWKENRKSFSFRGDSNWLGFNKCATSSKDVLAGWCESGSIFVADVLQAEDIL